MSDTPAQQAARRIAEHQQRDETPPDNDAVTAPDNDATAPQNDAVSDAPADQAKRMDTKPGKPPVGAGHPPGTYPKGTFGHGGTEG